MKLLRSWKARATLGGGPQSMAADRKRKLASTWGAEWLGGGGGEDCPCSVAAEKTAYYLGAGGGGG